MIKIVNREQTETLLFEKNIGVFIIRKSETIRNCFVLSVKVPRYIHYTTISHYLIESSKRQYKIRGCKKVFPSLSALVLHCSMIRDSLPIVLNMEYYKTDSSAYKLNEFAYYSSSCSSIASSTESADTCSSHQRSTSNPIYDFEF